MLRPEKEPLRKSPIPFMYVLFEGARSALPPIRKGVFGAIAFKTFPEAVLVATGPSLGSNLGKSSIQPAPSFPSLKERNSPARAGYFSLYLPRVEFHFASSSSPFLTADLKIFSAGSGI